MAGVPGWVSGVTKSDGATSRRGAVADTDDTVPIEWTSGQAAERPLQHGGGVQR